MSNEPENVVDVRTLVPPGRQGLCRAAPNRSGDGAPFRRAVAPDGQPHRRVTHFDNEAEGAVDYGGRRQAAMSAILAPAQRTLESALLIRRGTYAEA